MVIIRENVIGVPKPYHLCPVCGLDSKGTSRMCSSHYNSVYNSKGELILCNDLDSTEKPEENYSYYKGC